MAIAGKPNWQCLTTDHIGVPRGGLYGDVDKFEPILKQSGLFLCWSTIWHTFGVYHNLPGGEPVFDMHLKHKDGGPIPLDAQVVFTFIFLRETASREDRSLREEGFRRRNEMRRALEAAAAAEERMDRARRATDKAFLKLGIKSPTIFMDFSQQRSSDQ